MCSEADIAVYICLCRYINYFIDSWVYGSVSREDFVGLLALQSQSVLYSVRIFRQLRCALIFQSMELEYMHIAFRPEEREGPQSPLAKQICRPESLWVGWDIIEILPLPAGRAFYQYARPMDEHYVSPPQPHQLLSTLTRNGTDQRWILHQEYPDSR